MVYIRGTTSLIRWVGFAKPLSLAKGGEGRSTVGVVSQECVLQTHEPSDCSAVRCTMGQPRESEGGGQNTCTSQLHLHHKRYLWTISPSHPPPPPTPLRSLHSSVDRHPPLRLLHGVFFLRARKVYVSVHGRCSRAAIPNSAYITPIHTLSVVLPSASTIYTRYQSHPVSSVWIAVLSCLFSSR